MDVVPPAPSPPAAPPAAPPAPPASNGDDVPKSWDEVFRHDRFKELNKKAKDAQDALSLREKADKDREDAEALKRGDHEKVINDLRPKAERAASLETTIKSIVAAEIEQIPEARRGLVPDLPPEKQLDYITKNRAFLQGKKGDVNHPTNPADSSPVGDDKQTFTLAQIKDPARDKDGKTFYEKNRDAILAAQRDGRVRD